jgi:hypothetical protein
MSIYEWVDSNGRKWCIIATSTGAGDDFRYHAPLSRAGREATGKQSMSAATLDELGQAEHVPKFDTFEAAKRALPAARAVKLD